MSDTGIISTIIQLVYTYRNYFNERVCSPPVNVIYYCMHVRVATPFMQLIKSSLGVTMGYAVNINRRVKKKKRERETKVPREKKIQIFDSIGELISRGYRGDKTSRTILEPNYGFQIKTREYSRVCATINQ